jgi:hypothetical protein
LGHLLAFSPAQPMNGPAQPKPRASRITHHASRITQYTMWCPDSPGLSQP